MGLSVRGMETHGRRLPENPNERNRNLEMKTNNKQTVRLLIEEVFNKGNLNVIDEVIHNGYRYTSPDESMEGIEDLRAFVIAFRMAFPDLCIRIAEQIAEGDKVCTRIAMTGTHRGDFLGTPPTGKQAHLQGVIISRLEDGLIVAEWELLDQLTLLRQLGVPGSV